MKGNGDMYLKGIIEEREEVDRHGRGKGCWEYTELGIKGKREDCLWLTLAGRGDVRFPWKDTEEIRT